MTSNYFLYILTGWGTLFVETEKQNVLSSPPPPHKDVRCKEFPLLPMLQPNLAWRVGQGRDSPPLVPLPEEAQR